MRVHAQLQTIATVAALLAGCQASPVVPRGSLTEVEALKRGLPDSPTGGYGPAEEDCPVLRPAIRDATFMSPEEGSWLELRRAKALDPLKDFLRRAGLEDFDTDAYIEDRRNDASALPNIAIAASGGGYRAMLNGGGALKAFDSRVAGTTSKGGLGGLLQAATYVTGLSGGSWLVGSMFVNNFSSIADLQSAETGSIWELSRDIIVGPKSPGLEVVNVAKYWSKIVLEVGKKLARGFPVTITDYWGRALAYQLINAPDGGPGYTWSSIAQDPQFRSGDIPMPIVIADGRADKEVQVPLNTPVYEFNPFEFGTFDPSVKGFAPMRYIGSRFSGGVLPESERCVRGFDNAAFVMGTSSSLFNAIILRIDDYDLPQPIKAVAKGIFSRMSGGNNDIADYSPNPFFGYKKETNVNAHSKNLTLVDAGLDDNIPLDPLIQPVRQVDVILASDSSSDTASRWPNGSALIQTYRRTSDARFQKGIPFPPIPDADTILNLGLNTRPTFFGCDARALEPGTPLIVWLPNAPLSYLSNVSTFDMKYSNYERDAIIQNGADVVTRGSGALDAGWPACVACAVLSRSLGRTATPVPDACARCFERYCWNGTTASEPPAQPYAPPMLLTPAGGATNGTTPAGRPRSQE
ncbi:MAG: Lysophospholipase 1 [Thelocarpon impressellum]|nr:MAG: Lysophospholipase 1 [Thelocarpon impressellum]